jgi:FtsP/CotA-like multicopper oxidase with cupredoxin domain
MLKALWSLCILLLASFGAGAQPAGETARLATFSRAVATASPIFQNPPVIVSQHGVAFVQIFTALSGSGTPAFVYEGNFGVAPTVRVNPGDTIKFQYFNVLPPGTPKVMNMTNLHFHGLRVSPLPGSDDVLDTLAAPGQILNYSVAIPANHPPGLYWYHTHPHGETNLQTGEGAMSGAIVIEGLQSHLPVLATMTERILVIRAPLGAGKIDPTIVGAKIRRHRLGTIAAPGQPQSACANGPDTAHTLTVNGYVVPVIGIGPNEAQLFRVVNATGQRTLDLSIPTETLYIVALDGVPVDTYPGSPSMLAVRHIVVPPAGRVEFVVYGPPQATPLMTSCYYTGPVGDPDPAALLAWLRPPGGLQREARPVALSPLRVNPLPRNWLSTALPPPAQKRTTIFSENADGTQFFIDGKQFTPGEPPRFVIKSGTVEEWTVLNKTNEVHDFHIHQVHFIVEAINGVPLAAPYFWYDSFIIPYQTKNADGTTTPGSLKLLLDFRDPVIKGTFVYHCHLLDHEDKGMMATIAVK